MNPWFKQQNVEGYLLNFQYLSFFFYKICCVRFYESIWDGHESKILFLIKGLPH